MLAAVRVEQGLGATAACLLKAKKQVLQEGLLCQGLNVQVSCVPAYKMAEL